MKLQKQFGSRSGDMFVWLVCVIL